jgi:Pentapeptide repeats (8 copies)
MANDEHIALLQKFGPLALENPSAGDGVAAWNAWRKKNPKIRPDLREADLRHANLRKVNLSKANLAWADLRGADLSGADLRGARLNSGDLGISK